MQRMQVERMLKRLYIEYGTILFPLPWCTFWTAVECYRYVLYARRRISDPPAVIPHIYIAHQCMHFNAGIFLWAPTFCRGCSTMDNEVQCMQAAAERGVYTERRQWSGHWREGQCRDALMLSYDLRPVYWRAGGNGAVYVHALGKLLMITHAFSCMRIMRAEYCYIQRYMITVYAWEYPIILTRCWFDTDSRGKQSWEKLYNTTNIKFSKT